MPRGKYFPRNGWKCGRIANITLSCVSHVKLTTVSLASVCVCVGGGAHTQSKERQDRSHHNPGTGRNSQTSLQP